MTLPEKPKLFFAPISISGVTYYERLFPYLSDAYDAGFLFIGYDTAPFQQMVDYCKQKGYAFYVISLGHKRGSGIRIPLISPLRKMLTHKKECQEFLKTIRPSKLVFNKTTKPFGTMTHEANRQKVETIILQCALMAFRPMDNLSQYSSVPPLPAKIYYGIVQYIYEVLGFLYGSGSFFHMSGAVTPKKLGMIDEVSMMQILGGFKQKPKDARIVGTIEMQEAHELRMRAYSDAQFRGNLQKKHGIDPKKITILVLGFRLTRAIFADGKRSLSEDEHVALFRDIFTVIRKIFQDRAHIIFKMHPGDGNADVYESYKLLNVTLCGDDIRTDELVGTSDLCIIDPWTAANYLVSASGIPVICVDFAPVQGRMVPKDEFRIKEIVSTHERLREMLQSFKDGTLKRQYDNDGLEARSVEKIIDLIHSDIQLKS